MNPLVRFMVIPSGRITRVLAGVALIALGLLGIGGTLGLVITAIGAVPFLAGLFDFCVFAPLFGYSVSGPKIRAKI